MTSPPKIDLNASSAVPLKPHRRIFWLLIVGALLVSAPAPAATTRADWNAASKLLRDRLASEKATVVDVTEMKDTLGTLGTAFWVRQKVNGKLSGRLVVVRGTTIFEEPGDATISAILKADHQLTKHTISAHDFVYLLQELGTLPPGLGSILNSGDYDKRLLPKFAYGKGGATFVVYSFRNSPQTGTPGSPVTPPKLPLIRATLTIENDYNLKWKTEPIELPPKG